MKPRLLLPGLLAALLVPVLPVSATGFTAPGVCFTARKGDSRPLTDMGDCQVHFYSSLGGGTEIRLQMAEGAEVSGNCPGSSSPAYGTRGCLVNGEPGDIQIIGEEPFHVTYCAWRYRDPVAYCAIALRALR